MGLYLLIRFNKLASVEPIRKSKAKVLYCKTNAISAIPIIPTAAKAKDHSLGVCLPIVVPPHSCASP